MISNSDLVNYLISSGAVSSDNIAEAFLHVDRADFVADSSAYDIYGDYPLPISDGQTISQPTTVAMMLEMLKPQKGQNILDIGSGSGWTTALLGFIVGDKGSVIGVERVEALVKFGTENIEKYGFKNVKIVQAEDGLGIAGKEFDRILVSAAADEFPYELLEQLKVGGILVVPVRNSVFEIRKKENAEIEGVEHYGFAFVPLIV